MYKGLLGTAVLMWAIFIYLLWVVFDRNPFIILALGIIPIGFFVAGIVTLMKRVIS